MTELERVGTRLIDAIKELPDIKGGITLYLKSPNPFFGEWKIFMDTMDSKILDITRHFTPKGTRSIIGFHDTDLKSIGGQLHMLWFHQKNAPFSAPFMKIRARKVGQDYRDVEVTEIREVPSNLKGLL